MNPLLRLGELGQSPWYDYITRDLVASGELARMIRDDGLRGMTSNPTIFQAAIGAGAGFVCVMTLPLPPSMKNPRSVDHPRPRLSGIRFSPGRI